MPALTLVLVTLFGALAAQAQVTPDILLEQQRKAEEQEQRQEQITQPPAPSPITPPAPPQRPSDGAATALVKTITITGNTVIPASELEALVASAIGRTLTFAQLTDVADLISKQYTSKGYILARAYLPPQEISSGVVEIAVLEGQVNAIHLSGNVRYAPSTIMRTLRPVQTRGVLHERTLETALNELNSYPGLTVRANIKPGASQGVADLYLTAKERVPYTFGVDVNNYGSRFTGPWLYGGTVGIGNLTGLGDNLTVRYTESDDNLFLVNLGYLIPVTSFGTKVQVNWFHSENIIGGEPAFSLPRPVGRADIGSVDILQTITKTAGASLVVSGGFDVKTFRNIFTIANAAGNLQTKDELRVFRLGMRGEFRDSFLGRTYGGMVWHHGVDFWGATEQDAAKTSFASGSPGSFDKVTVDLTRYQLLRLPFLQDVPVLPSVLNDSYVILRAGGQLASDRLLSPERFSIGGYYTVRGYPVAERIGDNGYTASAEVVVPIPSASPIPFGNRSWKQTVQIAAFLDHGRTFATNLAVAQGGFGALTGAGAGLRLNLPFGVFEPVERGALTVKIDWATAIGRPRPSSRDQGLSLNGVYGDGAAGTLYVSASVRF